MTRIRHFAVAAAASASIALGLAGCMHDRPDSLGPQAVLAVQGDKNLTYAATGNGQVTVYDLHSDKVVFSGRLLAGQAMMVDVDHNKITVDGRAVGEDVLHRGDEYRLYFEPTSTVETNSTIRTDTTTVETSHDH